jgi:two-component system, response regulator, stage 0 sporulation protein F
VIPLQMVTILVAEDDRGIQTLLTTILTREGFRVECVSDGAEAMHRLERSDYDVVLLDLMMPTRSGHDVIRHLSVARESRQRVRATAATGKQFAGGRVSHG